MKIKKIVALASLLTIFSVNVARAQGLADILGGLLGGGNGTQQGTQQGSGLGSTLGNLLEGVFMSSDLTVADLAGEWTAVGPAVCFQSENFLKQAGGAAAAAAIESKLEPYYQQYGLTGSKLTVNDDATFTLVAGKIRMNGTITRNDADPKGVFEFNFTIMGKKLAGVTTYVSKTSTSMDVMFDATKLKNLLTVIGQFSGIPVVQTLTNLLDSYDGLCIGFNFQGTSANSQGGFSLGNILGGLGAGAGNNGGNNNGGKGQSGSNGSSNNGSNQSGNQQSTGNAGLDLLRGILNGTTRK